MSQPNTPTAKAATVLLIDDHPLLRNGIKELLELNSEIKVIAQTNNGHEGVALAQQHDPDLILLDINMPQVDGLETLKLLRAQGITSRIVIFTVSNYEEDVIKAMKLGADGYLLKDMEPEDMLDAIEQICLGKVVVSPEVITILATSLRSHKPSSAHPLEDLTVREKEILKLIAEGLANKLIARRLKIAESTVKVHVKHLLKKLNLRSRVEAAVLVHQEGGL